MEADRQSVPQTLSGNSECTIAEARNGDSWSFIGCAKLQSNRHYQMPTPNFVTSLMLFLSPNEQYQSTEGKMKYTTLLVFMSGHILQ